jgi:hypothetical protein
MGPGAIQVLRAHSSYPSLPKRLSAVLGRISTVPTWLLALIAGATLTWLVAYAGRVALVKREVEANDRALRVLDDHLTMWVLDDTVRLQRELYDITEELNKKNLFGGGHFVQRLTRAKERALQTYRDQERTARSQEADIRAQETQRHSLYRAGKKRPFGLTAPEDVKPILDAWAAPIRRHLPDPEHQESHLLVDDPRKRTVQSTLSELEKQPNSLT